MTSALPAKRFAVITVSDSASAAGGGLDPTSRSENQVACRESPTTATSATAVAEVRASARRRDSTASAATRASR